MKKSEIDSLFTNGRKIYTKTFKIVWLPSDNEGEIMVSAPIKIFKRANKRNRVKRLVREAVRCLDLSGKNVCIIYNNPVIGTFESIKKELSLVKI